jgi:hypothetical protein
VTGWSVPSAGQKIPVESGWYLPQQKIPLAEKRFLQASKGAENTKKKIRRAKMNQTIIINCPSYKFNDYRDDYT